MYCKKCGNEVKETMKFCPKCGTKIEILESADNIEKVEDTMSAIPVESSIKSNPDIEEPHNKTEKIVNTETTPSKRKYGGLIIALLIIGITILAVLSTTQNKVVTINAFEENPEKYFSVSGANGKGTAFLQTNEMTIALFDRIDSSTEGNGKQAEVSTAKEYMYYILSNDSPFDNLSNGDEVKFEFISDASANAKAGIAFDNTTYSFVVSGLEEIELLDIFKDIQITSTKEKIWSGYKTTYDVKNNSDNPIIRNFDYDVESIGNGIFRVTCDINENDLNSLGYGIDLSDSTICQDSSGFYKLFLGDSVVDINSVDSTNTGNDKIGSIYCKVNALNIRSNPSTSGSKLGKLNTGDTRDVFEKSSGEGYTWYRIGEGQWVADNGSWLNFTAN